MGYKTIFAVLQCSAPDLHSSVLTIELRNAETYRVGTTFTLTCASGKIFRGGGSTVIECLASGRWNSTLGFCGELPFV